MSDEMEIMQEFRELWEKYICTSPDADEVYKTFKKELEPAVKLEVLRQIKIMQGMGIMFQPVERFEEYTRTLQVAPQYCEGMQEAIDKGRAKIIDGKHWLLLDLVWDVGIAKLLHRCPFCEEGKNCIGENRE